MAYVELAGLSKSFAGKTAVQNLDLSIEKGEFLSLLGPSGCGKTTTLRIVAGFETPDTGAVRLGNQNLLEVAPNRRNIGVVFQNYALFPHLNARKNIAFGMKMAGQPESEIARRTEELLMLVGLVDSGSKFPQQMSGGQQQRIALARALAMKPRLLLLDEPLSALDAVVRVSLRDEIRRIQSSLAITTIYVTHDQEEALAISDRIVVMREGHIEQIGTAEEIYSQPASRFVAGFIGKMNQLPATIIEPAGGLVRCGSIELQVPAEETRRMQRTASVTVLVRPEAISISPRREKGDKTHNHLEAQVSAVTFLGSIRRIGLQVREHRFVADISAASGKALSLGESVPIAFPVNSCRLLVDEASINLEPKLSPREHIPCT